MIAMDSMIKIDTQCTKLFRVTLSSPGPGHDLLGVILVFSALPRCVIFSVLAILVGNWVHSDCSMPKLGYFPSEKPWNTPGPS